jgi:hypothetical protein
MAKIIPFPNDPSKPPMGEAPTTVNVLQDFIDELYEDGTVDRWKREKAERELARRPKTGGKPEHRQTRHLEN